MPKHIYNKRDLITRLEMCLGKTLEMIDDKEIFDHVQGLKYQKGIAGVVVEQCIFGYPADNTQEPDLLIVDEKEEIKTELKTTGLVIQKKPEKHFIAKEPMSITAVGIYDIAEQNFESSHFWAKLEHMLIIYYYFAATSAVSAYEYKDFPIVGYEFHEFSNEEIKILKNDWEYVRDFCAEIVSHYPDLNDKKWKLSVKQEYIDTHGKLRRVLSFIDLAPKFPPRFRLKKPTVSAMVAKHFGFELEQLPGRYESILDIDDKCRELQKLYRGCNIQEILTRFNLDCFAKKAMNIKAIAEKITVAMFGGTSKKLNQIELFQRFGLVGKTITLTASGGKTEDMKLYHIDFSEITRTTVVDDDGTVRPITFEDSEMYTYFADHEFLCIMFREPPASKNNPILLSSNIFIGFKRIVFSDEFIDTKVRKLWEDTREKIFSKKLVDVVRKYKDGSNILLKNGEISSAPNFMKSRENDVFIRGSGKNSFFKNKTECVNGIRMLPQYVWIKGKSVIEELKNTPEM